MFFLRYVFVVVVLKRFLFCFWWPLLSIFNACFDCLNEIDTLNDHIK